MIIKVQEYKKCYGRGIDVIVGDAIYLNEKFMLEIKNEGYQAVIRLKENNKKLLEDAEGLYKLKNPEKIEVIKK